MDSSGAADKTRARVHVKRKINPASRAVSESFLLVEPLNSVCVRVILQLERVSVISDLTSFKLSREEGKRKGRRTRQTLSLF